MSQESLHFSYVVSETVPVVSSDDIQTTFKNYHLALTNLEQCRERVVQNALASLSKAQITLSHLQKMEINRQTQLLILQRKIKAWKQSWNKKIEQERSYFILAQNSIFGHSSDNSGITPIHCDTSILPRPEEPLSTKCGTKHDVADERQPPAQEG